MATVNNGLICLFLPETGLPIIGYEHACRNKKQPGWNDGTAGEAIYL